jgi:hypothetical protein
VVHVTGCYYDINEEFCPTFGYDFNPSPLSTKKILVFDNSDELCEIILAYEVFHPQFSSRNLKKLIVPFLMFV